MTGHFKQYLALVIPAMLMLSAPVLADYGQADSPDFSLDLLTLPPGGTSRSADSADFAMDVTKVNRGWADSADFGIDTLPPPAPQIVSIECPNTVTVGQAFTVRVTLRNNGGPGDGGGVSASFPDLIEQDAASPPYNSAKADVGTDPGNTFSTVSYYDAGDTIYGEGGAMSALHLLVEGDEPAWAYNQERTLALTLTPKQSGSLKLRIRSWIGKDTPPVNYRDPGGAGEGRELDQQGYWANVVVVAVGEGALAPGSVDYVRARVLHDLGIAGTGVKIGLLEKDGLPWCGHYALRLISQGGNLENGEPIESSADDHATEVAGILVGNDPSYCTSCGFTYRGMAPDSVLRSAAYGSAYDIDNTMGDLVTAGCQVVNFSGGLRANDLQNLFAIVGMEQTINRFVDENKVSVVVSVGNTSQGHTVPASPAQTYNVISVGTTGDDLAPIGTEGDQYNLQSVESVVGPTDDIVPPCPDGRCKPDIVAAGRSWIPHPSTDPQFYPLGGPATSLAAPHVAGGVALLVQKARDVVNAGRSLPFVSGGVVDPRAIKCALLTGADKSVRALSGATQSEPNRPWAPGDPADPSDDAIHPLDYALGAGGLDIVEACKVILSEPNEDGNGRVTRRGLTFDNIAWQPGGGATASWSIGYVSEPTTLVATLVWNSHYDNLLVGIEVNNLDLYLKRDGVEVAQSSSAIDNVEHMFKKLTEPGNYVLEIRYTQQQTNQVDPEPFAVGYRLVPDTFGECLLTLSITNPSYGSVQVNPDMTTYPTGTTVTLTATPIEGKSFREWTIWGDPNRYPDANYVVTDDNMVLHLTMDHDYTVEAAFKCGSGVGEALPLLLLGIPAVAFASRRVWRER